MWFTNHRNTESRTMVHGHEDCCFVPQTSIMTDALHAAHARYCCDTAIAGKTTAPT